MSLQVEKLEKNMAKLTIEVPAEEFDKAVQSGYQRNKNKFSSKKETEADKLRCNLRRLQTSHRRGCL